MFFSYFISCGNIDIHHIHICSDYLFLFIGVVYLVLCVFTNAICLVLCGTDSALLTFAIVIPSSHNIATSLCYCNVDRFILIIIITNPLWTQ
jgi:hypothetical protein